MRMRTSISNVVLCCLVLLAAACIDARCLQMSLRIEADPDLAICRRYPELAKALERTFILYPPSVRHEEGERFQAVYILFMGWARLFNVMGIN